MAVFYTDSDVAIKVADFLWDAGHDAKTARDLRLESATDDEQLLVAAQQGRVFVTHNEKDYVLLHDAWQRWTSAWGVTAQHAGIIVIPQGKAWNAEQIATACQECLRNCAPLVNELVRWKKDRWQRRQGKDWIPCPPS